MQPLPERDKDDWSEEDEFDDEFDEDADASQEEDEPDVAADVPNEKDDEELPRDPGRENLGLLTAEFAGVLHREHGMPLTRANEARTQLVLYLGERFDGELEERESHWFRRQPKPTSKDPTRPRHPLCPDPATLDRFVAGLVGFFAGRAHAAASLMESIPAWLRFLESRGLLEAELHVYWLRALEPKMNALLKGLANLDDTVVPQNLRAAWANPKDL